MNKIIKRRDAITAGLSRYFTGKACKHGHISERYIISKRCVTCLREDGSNLSKDALERRKLQDRKRYANPDVKARKKAYAETEARRVHRRARERARRERDVGFRLTCSLRTRLNKVVKFEHKTNGAIALVGCSREELISHIERQFQKGMSWENYGTWHIDHIRPCSSFDLSDPLQQIACFHYTNLQPLFANDNLVKGKKIPE